MTYCSLLGHVTKDSHDNPSKENISNEKKIMLEYKVRNSLITDMLLNLLACHSKICNG